MQDRDEYILPAWRVSIVSVILLTVFWTVWYLVTGAVPRVHLTYLGDVSRWWDILAGAALTIYLCCYCWFIEFFEQKEWFDDVISSGFVITGVSASFLAFLAFFKYGIVGMLTVLLVSIPTIICLALAIFLICFLVSVVVFLLSKTPLWGKDT